MVTPSGGELEPGSQPIIANCLTKTGPAPAATRGDELFNIELQPLGQVEVDPSSDTASVTINSSDDIYFYVEDSFQYEGNFFEETHYVPVIRTGGNIDPGGDAIYLDCSFYPGPYPEAYPGEDFDPNCDPILFSPGDNVQYLQVRFYGDFIPEFDENFTIDLYEITGNPQIQTAWGVMTIANDD